MTKIYIDVPKSETLEEFLDNCFSYNKGFNNDNYYNVVNITYFDPEFTQRECYKARRSFEDLLSIVNTNFNEEITDEYLAQELYRLWNENKYHCIFCPDIEKIVFIRAKRKNSCRHYKMIDSYLLPPNNVIGYNGYSQYSLQDILDLAGQKDNYEVE